MKKLAFSILILAIVSYSALVFFSDGLILPDWKIVSVFCLMTVFGYMIKAHRWQILLAHYNMKISFVEAFKTYVAGLLFIITPAKAGEVIKAELMYKRHKFSRKKTVFLTLSERAFDIIAHLLLAGVTGLFVANQFLKSIWLVGVVFLAAILAIYAFRHKLHFVKEEIEQIRDWKLISYTTLISIASWLVEAIQIYLAVLYFGGSITMVESIFAFSASLILGNITMLPGGLGAAEAGMVGTLVVFNISRKIATSVTMLIRFTTLWFGFILGAVFWQLTYQEKI
ncbi:MAG: flippase-like domain-containing protein [Candidatus Altiarchaeota archaeon]|nr:flippase-like domain-containing protein [Candidatus Altiarchaeota archaeon]